MNLAPSKGHCERINLDLIVCERRGERDLGRAMVLRRILLFYCAVFIAGGHILYRLTSAFGKRKYIGFTILGGLLGVAWICLDGLFVSGYIFTPIMELVFKWASAGVDVNIDYSFRDDFPAAVIFMLMLNTVLPLITCLTVWLVHIYKTE